jgi:hypothetical protein
MEVWSAVGVRRQVERSVVVMMVVTVLLVDRHVRNLLAPRLNCEGRQPRHALPEHERNQQ